MHEILIEKTLNAPLTGVWRVLADFSNLSWYPMAERVEQIGEGIGQIRRIYMSGMEHPVDEKLERVDEAQHSFSYSIPGVPMLNYQVTVNLSDGGNGRCDVRWHATFDGVAEGVNADDMVAIMSDTYGSMLSDIERAAQS